MEKIFYKFLSFVLFLLLSILPFFFLNLTQEYFVTNKLYLLGFGVLLLILISSLQILVSRKVSWQKHPFDNLILFFLTAMMISTIFASPNKVQALLNPNFGPVMIVLLAILYFYISRSGVGVGFSDPKEGGKTPPLRVISIILSLITIIFYFQPFKNTSLPQFLAFLKNPGFTPVGSQLDLAILLGFFVIIDVINVFKKGLINQTPTDVQTPKLGVSIILNIFYLTLNLLALFLTVYSLVKPSAGLINQTPTLILPPFRLSWFAALEILKNPQTAFLGIGLDNFGSIFTRVKDFAYNQSSLWQINTFNVSRSAILQILTETGILGLLTFGLLIFAVFKQLIKGRHGGPSLQIISLFFYLLICLLIFPPSLIIWFLFFVLLGLINQTPTDVQTQNFASLPPIYLGIAIVSFFVIAVSGYFLGRSYASEYYFKKSLDGITNNNLKEVYNNQKQAIILNPYIERFHSNFAQTNLVIADNVANKVQTSNLDVSTKSSPANQLTEQDRQIITQAIQAAIAEGKAVVSLNPQKAASWQNLASIYQNVINAAKGADVWTISAYQRAILADPQNPIYRIGLGGVYYSLQKYDDALKIFEQAISLKPDWPSANYNYAWANFQKANYPQAVNAMQNALSLLDQKTNKADYDKVQKELAEFKKMLSKEASPEAK